MECDNRFCRHEKDGKCRLEKICLDGGGRCLNMETVEIPEELLDSFKAYREDIIKLHL